MVGLKVLWVSPVRGGEPRKIFEFSDPNARIDDPVWSPDGRWALFDRAFPQGGDIWMMRKRSSKYPDGLAKYDPSAAIAVTAITRSQV